MKTPILLIGPEGSGKTHITDAFSEAYDSTEYYALEEIADMNDFDLMHDLNVHDLVVITDVVKRSDIERFSRFAHFIPDTQLVLHSQSSTHIPTLQELDIYIIRTTYKPTQS